MFNQELTDFLGLQKDTQLEIGECLFSVWSCTSITCPPQPLNALIKQPVSEVELILKYLGGDLNFTNKDIFSIKVEPINTLWRFKGAQIKELNCFVYFNLASISINQVINNNK